VKPISFKQQNCIYAEHQPEYIPLPARKSLDGTVTSCWKFTILERLKILFKGKMYWQCLTFNQPLQPVMPSVSNPLIETDAL